MRVKIFLRYVRTKRSSQFHIHINSFYIKEDNVRLPYILMLFVIVSRYFITVFERQCQNEEYSNKFQQAIDSILTVLSRNIRDRRIYEKNKETEKKKRASDRSSLRQPNRYFMFLCPSISAPFPERFLVADYFRDLVFQQECCTSARINYRKLSRRETRRGGLLSRRRESVVRFSILGFCLNKNAKEYRPKKEKKRR